MLSFVMSPLLMPPLFGFQSASLFPALARSRIAERRSTVHRVSVFSLTLRGDGESRVSGILP